MGAPSDLTRECGVDSHAECLFLIGAWTTPGVVDMLGLPRHDLRLFGTRLPVLSHVGDPLKSHYLWDDCAHT